MAHVYTALPGEPTIAEIEKRITSMYEVGNPRFIMENDAFLTALQRSDRGWEIGNALLHSEDAKVQYYGALTLTVKLNQDGDKLDENQSSQLLTTLTYWLLRAEKITISPIVATKLCSTLAKYFCMAKSSWTKSIHTLVCSFHNGCQVSEDSLDKFPTIWELLPALTDRQVYFLLVFAMDLAEAAKPLSQQAQYASLQKRMESNTVDLEALLHDAFRRGQEVMCARDGILEDMKDNAAKVLHRALSAWVSWVFYAQSEFKNSSDPLTHLRTVFDMAVPCLELDIDGAIESFADILENYPKFLLEEQQRRLFESCVSSWGIDILSQRDDQSVTLVRMLIAYCQLLLNSGCLYRQAGQDFVCDQALSTLHRLLKCDGYVGDEDEITPLVADFWGVYVSTLDDEAFKFKEADEKPAWFEIAKAHTFQVVTELFLKIRVPPPRVTKTWDADSRTKFKSFRMDVRDLVQSAYDQIREPLLDHFIKVIQSALSDGAWLDVEAGLFCLNSIAEELHSESDAHIQHLLGASLFEQMVAAENIPAVTRRAAVEMVAHFTEFFLRNMGYVAPVLRFLVIALAQPALANSAAKSFASLCSSCRKALTGELESFFGMYQQFLGYQTADVHTKAKVMEGIAAIIEALPSDTEKATQLQALFQYISMDAQNAISQEHAGKEIGAVFALAALQCLTSIGKALQAPDEAVIDLESDTEKPLSVFWSEGPGSAIQNQINQFIQVLTAIYGSQGDVIEEACLAFRSGYKETVPGPFVLPPKATVDFMSCTDINTPRLPFVLDTACVFIRAHKRDISPSFYEQAQLLLRHVLKIMQQLGHPSTDPEVSVGCIEVIQRIINNNTDILNGESPDVLHAMFQFSIQCLLSPDVLPKRAAADLWNDIYGRALDMRHSQQGIAGDIVNHFGPAVTRACIFNVCGEADTSSLGYIVPPLRKIIQSQPRAKSQIQEALANLPLFIRAPEKAEVEILTRRFTEGLIRNARTVSAFKNTIKDFSMICKKLAVQIGPEIAPASTQAPS